MKTISLVVAAVLLLTLNACNTDNRQNNENDNREVNTERDSPVKMIEYLVGEWQIIEGARGGGGSRERKGDLGEKITFTSEARYIVYQGNQKVDSGAYRMNEQLNNLYLESEANENPREFELDLKSDTLTLNPKSGSGQRSTRYIYRRIGRASLPPDKSSEGDETEQTENQ
jgi:hypothetical protein